MSEYKPEYQRYTQEQRDKAILEVCRFLIERRRQRLAKLAERKNDDGGENERV